MIDSWLKSYRSLGAASLCFAVVLLTDYFSSLKSRIATMRTFRYSGIQIFLTMSLLDVFILSLLLVSGFILLRGGWRFSRIHRAALLAGCIYVGLLGVLWLLPNRAVVNDAIAIESVANARPVLLGVYSGIVLILSLAQKRPSDSAPC